jgi:hypothetical protein
LLNFLTLSVTALRRTFEARLTKASTRKPVTPVCT